MIPAHSDFITRARNLADKVVAIADEIGAVGSMLQYSDITTTLTAEDFVGENEHQTPEEIFAFLNVLIGLIGSMSTDDKKTVYAVKH